MFSAPLFTEDLCKGQLLSLNVMKKNEANRVTPSNFSFLELVLHHYIKWIFVLNAMRRKGMEQWLNGKSDMTTKIDL